MHKQKAGWSPFPSLRGFTLLELIVVIAIIGILSVAIVPSITGALAKARDARRVSDLNSIRTILVLYGAQEGGYPEGSPTEVADILNNYNNSNNIKFAGSKTEDGVHYVCIGYNSNRPAEVECSGFQLWIDLERTNTVLQSDDDWQTSGASPATAAHGLTSAEASAQGCELETPGGSTLDCVYDVRN